MNHQITFAGFQCRLKFHRYADSMRLAIQLIDVVDYSPVAMATVNMPEVPLQDGQVIIKDYSENQGMLSALQLAGIVEPTGRFAQSSFIVAPICRLLVSAPH